MQGAETFLILMILNLWPFWTTEFWLKSIQHLGFCKEGHILVNYGGKHLEVRWCDGKALVFFQPQSTAKRGVVFERGQMATRGRRFVLATRRDVKCKLENLEPRWGCCFVSVVLLGVFPRASFTEVYLNRKFLQEWFFSSEMPRFIEPLCSVCPEELCCRNGPRGPSAFRA